MKGVKTPVRERKGARTTPVCENNWLTINDAAAYLGMSTDFIRDMIVDGLHYYKVRHTCFVSKHEIGNYIKERMVI